jgi:hypothetical protein
MQTENQLVADGIKFLIPANRRMGAFFIGSNLRGMEKGIGKLV